MSQYTLIPDPNFEQALIDYGYDSGVPDGQVLTSNIAVVNHISLQSKNISDLTGIEDFSSLVSLDLRKNFLTTLNFSQNLFLKSLDCSSNPQLAYLNVSHNSYLEELNSTATNLSNLDVSANSKLRILRCGDNQLSFLDLTQNNYLEILYCRMNLITSLDVSNLPVLKYLVCSYNQLECLNIQNGNNTNFTSLQVHQNPLLTCVLVDNKEWSDANWVGFNFMRDPQTIFSLSCNDDCSLNINELVNNSSKELVKILDITGKEVQFQYNTLLIYLYNDGSVEKVYIYN